MRLPKVACAFKTERAGLQKARASQAPDRRVPERWRSPCRAASRAHIASLNRSERRASECMQENFRSNFTSKRKRPRFSAPLSGGRPMRIPADWAPLFPKSTYRTFLDIDPEKALLPLRGVPRPAGCPLSGSVLFVSDRIRYRLCSDRAAAREEPFQSLFPPMEISTSSFLRSHCRASSLPPAAAASAPDARPFQLLFPPTEINTSSFLRSHCRARSLPPAAAASAPDGCEAVSVSLSSDGNQHIEFSPIAIRHRGLPCQPAGQRCSDIDYLPGLGT